MYIEIRYKTGGRGQLVRVFSGEEGRIGLTLIRVGCLT
jgi:hypothetical protein